MPSTLLYLEKIVDGVVGQCESQIHVSRSLVSLRYSTAIDIITDALIIALPLYLAFRVQRPLFQKLALVAIFSLGIVIIIFAIIRIGKHLRGFCCKLRTFLPIEIVLESQC